MDSPYCHHLSIIWPPDFILYCSTVAQVYLLSTCCGIHQTARTMSGYRGSRYHFLIFRQCLPPSYLMYISRPLFYIVARFSFTRPHCMYVGIIFMAFCRFSSFPGSEFLAFLAAPEAVEYLIAFSRPKRINTENCIAIGWHEHRKLLAALSQIPPPRSWLQVPRMAH